MQPTVVLNVVGLSEDILSKMPKLRRFAESGGGHRVIEPVFPAVTCSAQATYLTGLTPSEHGIVGNGWYFEDLSQVWFWRQSNRLVAGEKLWESARARDPSFRCANLFWWFNMYSSVDYSVTPRPVYRADGLKLPDIYSHPPELRSELQDRHGPFPLFQFWGPGADIRSSRWIARASQQVFERERPTLSLIYLPHLDYCLQREGPEGPSIAREAALLDDLCAELISYYEGAGCQVVALSEYGIHEVSKAIPINRILREHGWLKVHSECGEDHFDPGASRAFAVADHQIAHVYIPDPSIRSEVRHVLEREAGIATILGEHEKVRRGVAHSRSGDLVLEAEQDYWFTYSFWLENNRAPDFARTVDIHRKPGYDPVELFLDPQIRFPKARMFLKLLGKKLGFRYRMDFISLDHSLVRGSHGSSRVPKRYQPLFITRRTDLLGPPSESVPATRIKTLLMDHLFEREKAHD